MISLDVHTARNAMPGDGAHARVSDRDTGGFVSRGSYRRTPSSSSSSSRSSDLPRVSPSRFVSRCDSHFLERLTPSVDPCRRRSSTAAAAAASLVPLPPPSFRSPVRITKATKVDDTKVETRFSSQCRVAAALFSTIQLVASLAFFPTKRQSALPVSGISYCRIVAGIAPEYCFSRIHKVAEIQSRRGALQRLDVVRPIERELLSFVVRFI